jgi:hypothetical protein
MTEPCHSPSPNGPPTTLAREDSRHSWTVLESNGTALACDLVSHGKWGWEVVLSRNGRWYFGQRFPTVELAELEADDLERTFLREGRVLLR